MRRWRLYVVVVLVLNGKVKSVLPSEFACLAPRLVIIK